MGRSSSRHKREIYGIDSAGEIPPDHGEISNDDWPWLGPPRARTAVVVDATHIQVVFSGVVVVSGVTGIEYQIDAGAWVEVTGYTGSGAVWDFTTGTIAAGDDVVWRYIGGSNTIVDPSDNADIGDQEIPVDNPLVIAGHYILMESGGADIILLEDDTNETSGLLTEDAT